MFKKLNIISLFEIDIMVVWNKMSNSKKLSVSKIKKLIRLFKFIVSQKSNDKTTCLAFLNENSVDDISESINNIL